MKYSKREQVVTLFCILLLSFLLPSCAKKNQHNTITPKQGLVSSLPNTATLRTSAVHHEVALINIPLPLYDEIIVLNSYDENETNDLVFAYKTSLSKEEIGKFFLDQMERYGWKHLITFNHVESLMQFESPDRYCTVSVRQSAPKDGGSQLYIFVSQKIVS